MTCTVGKRSVYPVADLVVRIVRRSPWTWNTTLRRGSVTHTSGFSYPLSLWDQGGQRDGRTHATLSNNVSWHCIWCSNSLVAGRGRVILGIDAQRLNLLVNGLTLMVIQACANLHADCSTRILCSPMDASLQCMQRPLVHLAE